MITPMKPMTIGSLARSAGVGVQTVRFYERKGLLPKPARTASGYREFLPEDARRIRFIRRAQELGFTLKEVQELLELNSRPKATCSDIRRRAEGKIGDIEKRLHDLRRMRKTLKQLASACGVSGRAVSECRILDCFESGWNCD
jgi:Hg(II)-responsive transcriptional regulator